MVRSRRWKRRRRRRRTPIVGRRGSALLPGRLPRRHLVLTLGALLGALVVAGCGGDDAGESTGSAASPPPAVTAPPTPAPAPPAPPEEPAPPAAAGEPDAEPDAEDSAPTAPTPLEFGPLEPGEYGTVGFLPAFTFTVADRGWTADFDDADVFQIVRPALDGFLSIGRGGGVITPGPNPQPQRLPDDLIAWIAGHPDLEAGEPVDTEIDGIRAVQIEVEARVDTQLFIRARSDEGVTIGTQQPPGVLYGLDSGALAKLTILEVEGARVVISIDGAPGTWDEFVALADAVVASIDFR